MSQQAETGTVVQFLEGYAGLDKARQELMMWLLRELNALPEGASHLELLEEAYKRAAELDVGSVVCKHSANSEKPTISASYVW